MCHALAKGDRRGLPGGRGLPPADDRGGEDAGEAARHRPARGAGGVGRLRARRALRGPPAVPDHGRPRARLRAARGARARRGGDGGGRHRPPRPRPAAAPRRVRRRHRGRHQPALRRAHGLRRAARRLPGHARRAQAPAAGPHRGRVQGRRGPARLPAVAADAGAAHPTGQGHEQHLHRAGAARGHGRDVRRVSRGGGADRDRAARPRPDLAPRPRPPPSGNGRGRGSFLRHPCASAWTVPPRSRACSSTHASAV